MKCDNRLLVEKHLNGISEEHLHVIRRTELLNFPLTPGPLPFQMSGKEQAAVYPIFPGVEVFRIALLASEITLPHKTTSSALELFYCHCGRIAWNKQGNTAVFLRAGDIVVYNASCTCPITMFPLGYAEGLSLSINLDVLNSHFPTDLRQPRPDFTQMQKDFCNAGPVTLRAHEELTQIFESAYKTGSLLPIPCLKLKIPELLLYLSQSSHNQKGASHYFLQQTELIKEIHTLLTAHLERRYTIKELSKLYAINTSTLKTVFKAVYGLPIATYMKNYRVWQAMKLLQGTNCTVAQIAEQVGYESQGKFANAFKNVAQILPTEYRKYFAGRKNLPL